MEEDNTAVVKRDNNSRSIFPWPFSTGEANDANQEKTEINNQSIFPKPNVFSQLSWPTWSQDASNDNDKKIDKEGYLERTKRLFSTSWSKDDKDLEKKDEGMMAKSKNYLQSKWSSWSGS